MKISVRKIAEFQKYLLEVLNQSNNQIKLEQLRVKEYSNKINSIQGNRTTILPWSGGLDSTTSLLMALESGNDVITVSFNYGQEYWNKEKETIKKLRKEILKLYKQSIHRWLEHIEINISWFNTNLKEKLGGEWQHIFPLRNFLLLMECANVINNKNYREIWFSCVQGEIPFSGGDKSVVFLTEVSKLLSSRNYLLTTPLIGLNKADLVNWALYDRTRYKIITGTSSCFSGTDKKHCGRCLACFNRLVGFYSAGVVKDCGFIPKYSELEPFIAKYQESFKMKNYYSPSRKNNTLGLINYLKKLS